MEKKIDFDTVILGFVGLVLIGFFIAGIITLVKKAFKPSENIYKLDSSDMIHKQKLHAEEIKATQDRMMADLQYKIDQNSRNHAVTDPSQSLLDQQEQRMKDINDQQQRMMQDLKQKIRDGQRR